MLEFCSRAIAASSLVVGPFTLLVCWQKDYTASSRCSAYRRKTVTLGRPHIGGGFAGTTTSLRGPRIARLLLHGGDSEAT
ncbi:hypothetical protein BKA58DRAFT_380335 [Alternaria rosae]|uniref:uncharacterized protein n=1 Tax=Alternaria rosae TaxID=1187941 RepID=UPI001E8D1BCE|nr:uncharacterized protein BKA58DRAFT_380335 [Alternaria rosae]KAH6875722.1 hypothetical protein BKA58DRAFT_380335 [Alternaria rosae]